MAASRDVTAAPPHRLRSGVLVRDDGTAVRVPRVDLDERDEKGRELYALLWLHDTPEEEREAVAYRLAAARTRTELRATAEALAAEGVNVTIRVRAERRVQLRTVADVEAAGIPVIYETIPHGRLPHGRLPHGRLLVARPRERRSTRRSRRGTSRARARSPGRLGDDDSEPPAALLAGGAA